MIDFNLFCHVADVPSGHELSNYYAREDERVVHRVIRDSDPIGASYDRYLRSSVLLVFVLAFGI